MNEQERIKNLLSYEILDTSPEKELDELAEIASAVCNTSMSLITMIDDERQWFKSKRGIDIDEVPREYSFCQYALNRPDEVLVVSDPLHDDRFKDNPFVVSEPKIRFYAGAPLQSPNGHVLGTLCVLDNEPKDISKAQKEALKLLAKKAMDFLNARKLLAEQSRYVELSAARLKNLTDQVPGVVYQFQMAPEGEMSFEFLSKGFTLLFTSLDPEALKKDVRPMFELIHSEDLPKVMHKIKESFDHLTPFQAEYRVLMEDGVYRWHISKSRPEKLKDGTVVWYGIFQDVTLRKEYEQSLEQMAFDISHVIRRPISSLLGLVTLIENDHINAEQIKEYNRYIKVVAHELDEFTQRLYETYYERKVKSSS